EGVGVAVGVGPRGTRPPAASRAVGVACGHVSGGHVMFISHVVPPGGGTAGYVLSDAIQTRPATQPPGSLTAVWVAVLACYLGRRVPSVRRQASPVTDGHGSSSLVIARQRSRSRQRSTVVETGRSSTRGVAPVNDAPIRRFYDSWPRFNDRLKDAVAGLTQEQLALRPSSAA